MKDATRQIRKLPLQSTNVFTLQARESVCFNRRASVCRVASSAMRVNKQSVTSEHLTVHICHINIPYNKSVSRLFMTSPCTGLFISKRFGSSFNWSLYRQKHIQLNPKRDSFLREAVKISSCLSSFSFYS